MVGNAPEHDGDATKPAAVDAISIAMSHGAIPKQKPAIKLPNGLYTMVSIDIDTTGRRLTDEIVQLAAYSATDHYEQYIMPYMNLNPAARQRHQVRVISIGIYRMLKSMQTCKIIKSKSEVAALNDFLDWLEALKAKEPKSLGVVLIYHEERKFIPYMILQALNKYNLLDRFLNTVNAFANGRLLAQNLFGKEPAVRQPYTLHRLARYINSKFAEKQPSKKNEGENIIAHICEGGNDNENCDGNASVRARLTYEVAHYLCNLENRDGLDTMTGNEHLLTRLLEEADPITIDLCELKTQNENVERQNSFGPVFFVYFRATLYHRMRAVKFRIVLAEHGYDLNSFNAIWQKHGRDGLLSALQTVNVFKPEERHELSDLFDNYFDPKKSVIGPIVNNNRRRNRRTSTTQRGRKDEGNTSRPVEPGAGGDKQNVGALPDSTNKSPNGSGGSYNKTGRQKRFNARGRNDFRKARTNQTQQEEKPREQQLQHKQPKSQKRIHLSASIPVMNSGGAGNMNAATNAMPQPHRVVAAN